MTNLPKEIVKHPGVVVKTGPDEVEVMILAQSACAACHAKGACTMADMKEKMVKIKPENSQHFSVGQQVVVSMKQSMGLKAVLLGYILPFVVMVFTLAGLIGMGFSEGKAGLTSLLVLVFYYVLLFIFRSFIEKSFEFTVSEIDSVQNPEPENLCF